MALRTETKGPGRSLPGLCAGHPLHRAGGHWAAYIGRLDLAGGVRGLEEEAAYSSGLCVASGCTPVQNKSTITIIQLYM
jgi:hypothetical protein